MKDVTKAAKLLIREHEDEIRTGWQRYVDAAYGLGSTDLCAWNDVDAVQSLPIVDLVRSGLSLVRSGR